MRKKSFLCLLILLGIFFFSQKTEATEPCDAGLSTTESGHGGLLNIYSARTLPPSCYSIGVYGNYVIFTEKPDYVTQSTGKETDYARFTGTLSYTRGMTDRLEIGLSLPYVYFRDNKPLTAEDNLGDLLVGLKYRFNDPEYPFLFKGSLYQLGALAFFNVPSSNKDLPGGLKTGNRDVGLKLILTREFGLDARRFFHLNLGYTFVNEQRGGGLDDILTYGAGVDLPLGPKLNGMAEIEGSQNRIHKEKEDPLEAGLGLRYGLLENQIVLDLGLRAGLSNVSPDWRAILGVTFHPNLDPDGDKIFCSYDQCPCEPEDYDNFQDEDGCPDLDNDSDQILDIDDQCPGTDKTLALAIETKEDYDGFADEDGCPDFDNDDDGILDIEDQCPGSDVTVLMGRNTKEDHDGFAGRDGCPDPDNDSDGILDVDDKCPGTDETVARGIDTKENYNGFKDEDGCPDILPPDVLPKIIPEEIKGEKIIISGIHFELNKAIIKEESKPILDKVVNILKSYPRMRIRIEGHTDSLSSDEYNRQLSQERAGAVRTYLVRAGIREDRLVTIGKGEREPVADNSTKEGRAKNRRIEFIIIEGRSPDIEVEPQTKDLYLEK